jgi:hypothetical protein
MTCPGKARLQKKNGKMKFDGKFNIAEPPVKPELFESFLTVTQIKRKNR